MPTGSIPNRHPIEETNMNALRYSTAVLALAVASGSGISAATAAGAARKPDAVTTTSAKQFALGALAPKVRVEPPKQALARSGALPASVDLSQWTMPVANQGNVLSCVSWAIGYAMLGWYSRHDFGIAQSMAPMFVYSQTKIGGLDSGSWPTDALTVLKNQGIDTASHYSHDGLDWWDLPGASERSNAQHFTIRGFTTLFANNAASTIPSSLPQTVLMNELAKGHPAALMISVRDGFRYMGRTSDAYDTDTQSLNAGLHEVLAIGYDAHGVLVQNSWGTTNWGFPTAGQPGGFGRIGWNVVQQDTHEIDTIAGFGNGHHDFTGDGANDLIARRTDGNLFTYRGNGRGGFGTPMQSGSGAAVFSAIVPTRDFNGNGTNDVIARKTDGTLWLYDGTANGVFGGGQQIGQGWNVLTAILAPGDFNGDGTADLIGRKADGTLWLYGGDGHGGWVSSFPQIGQGWNVLTAIVAPGDFNGDGTADLIGRKADGTLWLYGGDGHGGWVSSFPQIGQGWNVLTAIVAPGDWNGDGRADLIGRKSDGTLWLYGGDGHGGWLSSFPQIGTGWNTMNVIG